MWRRHLPMGAVMLSLALAVLGCDDDEPSGPVVSAGAENTGQSCTSSSQCYAWLDGAALRGESVCLDRVPGGYCSHQCTSDADCCAIPGECKTAHPQVCAPFESTSQNICFLSCEEKTAEQAGVWTQGQPWDGDAYCGTYAHAGFRCRSTGGGSSNRKVCVP